MYELSTPNPQLPDAAAILPYVGLYTIVYLKSTELQDVTISSSYFPPLSFLHSGQWGNAPNRTSSRPSTASDVAHIFDSLAINAGQKPSPGLIPLSIDPHHPHKQYWRIPKASPGGMLSAIVLRSLSSTDEMLGIVRYLHALLILLLIQKKRDGLDVGLSRGSRGGKGQGTQKRAAEEGSSTSHSSNKQSIKG